MYPYLKKNPKLKSIVAPLISEEKSAAKAIAKIKRIKSESSFEEKIFQLKTAVAQHAKDEETKLLPKARKFIAATELNIIGKKMKEFKKSFDKKK
ncbi:MAG: hemerythrin domain-containing protein [Gammaproteobacteria bacterium]